MKLYEYCDSEYNDGEKVCHACGAFELSNKCRKCGTVFDSGCCLNCGYNGSVQRAPPAASIPNITNNYQSKKVQ